MATQEEHSSAMGPPQQAQAPVEAAVQQQTPVQQPVAPQPVAESPTQQQHQHHQQQQQQQQQPVAQQGPPVQQAQVPSEAPQHQQVQQVHHVQHQQSQQQAAAPQVPSPHVPVQQLAPPANAQQAAVAAAAAAVTVPVNMVQNPNASPGGGSAENLICQWTHCQERLPTAEALYEHVCERHVGRKSTNNLNLTCGWANCRTTTVKRDHITSHIRVHVPLKPHKCDFCGKAFKRPQDLKKHVKTHADDSVLVRSPDPNAGARPPNGMYNVGLGPDNKPTHYFEGSLGQVPGAPYGHPPPHYYQQPHPQHPQHPQHHQHPQNPAYGNVYYSLGNDASHQAAYESKKRGYDALNEFFGELKRRQLNSSSYEAIGNRLMPFHQLFPLGNSGPTPEYQTAPAMVSVGGHGYGGAAPAPLQPYHLPPMGNLRTKADLLQIDHYLEQMQATVLENDDQAGAQLIPGNMSYRPTNSPPTAVHIPSAHANAAPVMPPSSMPRSRQNSTPALTPPSSAQSHTSGRSPIPLSSTHHGVPHGLHQSQPSMGMYPTLPASASQEQHVSSYAGVSGAVPPSTLSSAFENEDRRRYGGGMLQRSQPYSHHVEHERRDSSDGAFPQKFSDDLVDPALRRSSDDHRQASATPTQSNQPQPQPQPNQSNWVDTVRTLSSIRDLIRSKISEMGERDDHQQHSGGMSDAQLYPTLKMHLDDMNGRMDES